MPDDPAVTAAALRCRCVWRGERCENQATEEDGLCNWCCRTQRSISRLRQDPRAIVLSDTEVSIGGAGQTHDSDANKPASTAACWYPDSDRVVINV